MNKSEKREVRAIVRTYKDENGEDKNVYQTVGTAWVSEHASQITIQLETLPVSPSWNGKFYITKPYEKKNPDQKYQTKEDAIDLAEIPF